MAEKIQHFIYRYTLEPGHVYKFVLTAVEQTDQFTLSVSTFLITPETDFKVFSKDGRAELIIQVKKAERFTVTVLNADPQTTWGLQFQDTFLTVIGEQ